MRATGKDIVKATSKGRATTRLLPFSQVTPSPNNTLTKPSIIELPRHNTTDIACNRTSRGSTGITTNSPYQLPRPQYSSDPCKTLSTIRGAKPIGYLKRRREGRQLANLADCGVLSGCLGDGFEDYVTIAALEVVSSGFGLAHLPTTLLHILRCPFGRTAGFDDTGVILGR